VKWSQRHPAAIWAAVLFLLATTAVSGVSAVLVAGAYNREAVQRKVAESEREIAKEERQRAESERDRAEKNFLHARVAIRDTLVSAATGTGVWSQLPPSLRDKFTKPVVAFYGGLLQENSSDPSLQYETAVGYIGLSTLHNSRQEFQQAETLLRQSITILDRLCMEYPDTFYYRNQLAWSHFALFSTLKSKGSSEAPAVLEKAIALYEQFLRDDPNVRDYVAPLGQCYAELFALKSSQGKPDDGLLAKLLTSRREWVRLSPNEPKAIITLARTLAFYPESDRQKLEEAVKWAQKLVKLAPRDSVSWSTLGVVHYCAGNHRDAVRALVKSSKLNKDRPSNFLYLAMAEWRLGNPDAAREWYAKASNWMEQRPQVLDGDLLTIRADAEELLGISEPASTADTTTEKNLNEESPAQ